MTWLTATSCWTQLLRMYGIKNPVNGPTGGIDVYFESDEAGVPIGEYETVDWTVTQKTRHYYSAPGEEVRRITDSLEKVRLQ